jgi:hypothetical protein
MSGVALQTEFPFLYIIKWQTRNDGDAVIALLSIDCDVLIAEFANFGLGELAIATFGFLQAKDIWLVFY